MTSSASPTRWFITGVSSGLGRALAKAVLADGGVVTGTVRRDADRAAFEALSAQATAAVMDVADAAAVRRAVEAAEARMGGIDILVNNAGYGLVGAIEEASLDEMRAQFEVNLFGPLAVIQAVLPGMRARRGGRILNVTSVSGLSAWGGTGIYCASKFALVGATLALAQEVAELGIRVTNVAPGGLRTDYSGRSLVLTERTIDDYEGAGHFPRRVLREHLGQEPGDPDKAAAAILEVAKAEHPPMHLLLGADAVHYATRAAGQFQTDLSDWLALTLSTAAAPS
jgi:NAD(P)-dependent dehydrogenase (short-subunit alcohol dehydrogenase family)